MKQKRWSPVLAGCVGAGLALSLAACGDTATKELTGQWLYYDQDSKIGVLPLEDYEPGEEDEAVAVGIVLQKDGIMGYSVYMMGSGGLVGGQILTAHSDPPETWQTDGETLTITESDGGPSPLSGRYGIEGDVLTIDLADGGTLELRRPDS
ncbi:MAG: hypothetical protein LBK95_14945 [Bifidobacteriaceae bacterium]|jgi:hypothetical protein|nr:hypothetical protein [Bifidobacteriaceae bacterium]